MSSKMGNSMKSALAVLLLAVVAMLAIQTHLAEANGMYATTGTYYKTTGGTSNKGGANSTNGRSESGSNGGSKGGSKGAEEGGSKGGSKGGDEGGRKGGSKGGSEGGWGHSGGSSHGGGHHGGGKGPDCNKYGGMCGDPRIVGGDGVVFFFHGQKNKDFCLVSDSDLHVNAHFIGKRPEGRVRDFTWVQALGFVSETHSLSVAAKRVAKWENRVDQLEFSFDGESFEIQTGEGESWTSPDGKMRIDRLSPTNSVDLKIKEKMGVALNVVPIKKKESDVHNYGITEEDCFAHFDMQFRFYNLSSSVNGVMGQTYQPDFVSPVKKGAIMPTMGGADRFSSSSLLATDCKMSQFTATAIPAGTAMPSFNAECGSSNLPAGVPGGIVCRR